MLMSMKSRLRFSDNEWTEVDRFFRDTVAWEEDHEVALRDMRHWIAELDRDLSIRTSPEGFLSLLDPSAVPEDLLPTAIASALVASMCERLAVIEQLVYGVTSAARQRDLLNAALCARSVAEVVADTHRFQARIEGAFSSLRADGQLQADMHAGDGQMVRLLGGFRHGGRLEADLWNAPRRTNALTEVDRIGSRFRAAYDELSEMCHPNAAAAAQYWRVGHRIDGTYFVPFTPTDGGSTPSKIAVMNAPWMAASVIVPFARTMWWMASLLSVENELWRSSIAVRCGLPVPTGRNEPCVCGSGQKSKYCDHPEPPLLPHP
jgi:hypothetical protein